MWWKNTLFRIEKVNENNFKDISNPCKYCLYWQTNGDFDEATLKPDMEQEKRQWFNNVTKKFGVCIKIAYFNSVPIGFTQYGPANFFPRVKEYKSGPPSEDAVFIACLYITDKEKRRKGFGTVMLEDLIVELKERGFKAIETFARRGSENNPSGPIELYLKHNFKMKNGKGDFPLLRLEL